MAKNQSLPAHLQEKDSRGEGKLKLVRTPRKPAACRPRPSLPNPRSTNDIVRVFSRVNPTLLRSVTNRVLTIGAVCGKGSCVGIGGGSIEFLCYF